MHKQLGKNKRALSSLALILLLLISAIIGGLISYVWVMGYYISLKEKIPARGVAVITGVDFNPQNATAFNVTVLNPSYSPDEQVRVDQIGLSEQTTAGATTQLNTVSVSTPSLPFDISRGNNQTFLCSGDWISYMNKTVVVSLLVENGSGSTSVVTVPYTQLWIRNIDFNPERGVQNFTITLGNDPRSATYLNVTAIEIGTETINSTRIKPNLPSLVPNSNVTLTIEDWSSYATAGGSQPVTVFTKQGYSQTNSTNIPRVSFALQQIMFDPTDTTHFNVTVKSQVSTNTYLNVTKIEVISAGNTTLNYDATPKLNSSTNGVLGSSTATFKCAWNWTNYRNKNVIVTVYMLQGVQTSGQQTPQTALLSIPEEPVFPDTQHFFVTVKNSQHSVGAANVTKITLTFLNGTEKETPIVQPAKGPYLIPIGNETMFSCSWNWANYMDKTVNINIYTDEGFATFRAVITPPMNTSNYQTYLTIPHSPGFNASDTMHFNVTVNNGPSSNQSITITGIAILANGTGINAASISPTLPVTIQINGNATFSCQWDWTKYRNESIVILISTDEGLKAIYVTKTPS